MTITIDLSPQAEAWISTEARILGVAPSDLAKRLLDEGVALQTEQRQAGASTDPTIALLESWLAEDATDDPEVIHGAEVELAEFKRSLNAPRREAGERLIYPESK